MERNNSRLAVRFATAVEALLSAQEAMLGLHCLLDDPIALRAVENVRNSLGHAMRDLDTLEGVVYQENDGWAVPID